MSPSTGQTVSFLIRRFREAGIRPDTRHGQNFLVDLNLQDLIVRTADLQPTDVVLEVGTGTGALTARMAGRAAAVVSFEIDPQLYQLASEELIDVPNVTLIRRDVLKNKNHFNPEVMDQVRQQMDRVPGARFKLVANLPYNIATPVVSNLLCAEIVPALMSVTIQKELADRMTAEPRSKDYGALSIWVQSQCDVHVARVLPPSVFWPRPKVESAILRIDVRPEKRDRIADLAFFHQFVRSLFLHRRKFLRACLRSTVKGQLEKAAVDEILGELGFAADCRAEQLDIGTMLALCEAVRARLPKTGGG
jgi:16S rRNA (adenine1518-N6/adenine1519-N6)-dimethyltransferase